ncbi:MAG: hypothetical protein KDD33_06755 [Bdellovibrionales bacterium]|nr:hypothetical protein [Bdellovibrionales bacterium]
MQPEVMVKDLIQYIPHRPPMIWVDSVIKADRNEKGIHGICAVKLDKDALYFDEKGHMRASAAIEFVGQGYGYVRAQYQVKNNIDNTPDNTYLTGVRHAEVDFSEVRPGANQYLMVHIQLMRSLHPIYFVRGEIFDQSGEKHYGVVDLQIYVD